MIERAVLGGILVAAGLASPGVVQAQEADGAARPSVIFNLINRPSTTVESRERAFNEAIKQDALAPRQSPLD
jgi:hypothetical protein